MLTRFLLFLLWLLHWLPLPWLARIGNGLGRVLYLVGRERRQVALINLRLCFPDMLEADRRDLVRRHVMAFARSVLERGIAWWASPERLRKLIRFEGTEHLEAVAGRPILLMVPHFTALDMGWTRFTLDYPMAAMYANQKNPVFNAAMFRGRLRFGDPVAMSRQQGLRAVVKALKKGRLCFYLPDQDYGPKDALFVPFFGVPAATIVGVSRVARMADAAVLPCYVRALEGGQGYRVEIQPAWDNFPTDDLAADTRRVNAAIEQAVLTMPEQYFWLHKRFKTRPEGEASFYRK